MKKMSQLPTAVESLEEEDVEAVVQQSERYPSPPKILQHAYFVNYWLPI